MTRTGSIIAAALLVVVACKDDKKGGGSGKGSGGCELASEKPADWIAGKAPQPIAPFAALKLGMAANDVRKACPNLFADEADAKNEKGEKEPPKTGTFSAGEVVGRVADKAIYGRLSFIDDKLAKIEVDLPTAALDALTAAWGQPATSTPPGAHAWHDPATGTRAMLGPDEDGRRMLAISAFAPLEAFVEIEPTRLAFKPPAVLGKTGDQLLKEMPQFVKPDQTSESTKKATEAMMADMKKDIEAMGVDLSKQKGPEVDVVLPATPFGEREHTQGILHYNDDGTVRNYAVWFRTKGIGGDAPGWPQEIAALQKLMDEKWGAHKTLKRTLGEEANWYDPKNGIRASARIQPDKPDELDLSYVRYMPLATFFGQPGPVWGFEKPERPLLGATPEELTAAYGNAVEIKDQTATLRLPPTDYDDDVAMTHILMFIRGGKVAQWRVSLTFEEADAIKGEYEQLLATKFAPPKPGKFERLIYSTKPLVTAKFSTITHAVDLEVGDDGF